jgi:glycosyltransferase involved in cell wall biosynthesis
MVDFLGRISLARIGGRIRSSRQMGRVPRVSVVIPCYNYGRYLPDCIASVTTNQPGVAVEVIIVDDKSTDDSLEIAQTIAKNDDRVRVIAHDRNFGHIATYNDGLDAATGEFVLLLSADDLLTAGALTRAAALLVAEESVGFVYGNVINFQSRLPPCRTTGTEWIIWPGVDWLRARCRSGYNIAASPEVVMRTSVLRKIGVYRPDLPHAGDFEMWLRAATVSDVGFLVGVDQAYYRQHSTNMHRRAFESGSARGQLKDLKQRWLSFEAVFLGIGSQLSEAERLFTIARRTMASQALRYSNYAYARGFREFPFAEFESFATAVWADANRLPAGRGLARRKRLGMLPLPLHPLWAPAALGLRLWELIRRWRRSAVGV